MSGESKEIKLSSLAKTWLFDLDGTVVLHNGYRKGGDSLLEGAKKFFDTIPEDDKIIFLTSRGEEMKEDTECFLRKNRIRYDGIFYGLPYGERILINDKKPSGLCTAIAINTDRDEFMRQELVIDEGL